MRARADVLGSGRERAGFCLGGGEWDVCGKLWWRRCGWGEGDAHVAFGWFLRDSKSELDGKFLMLVYEKAFA